MSWTKKGRLEGVREIGELMGLPNVLSECQGCKACLLVGH